MAVGFEHLLRELAPQVLGTVVRRYRDFAAAEDAVQEALRRGNAVAQCRNPGKSSRLADSSGVAPHDGPDPLRLRAASA